MNGPAAESSQPIHQDPISPARVRRPYWLTEQILKPVTSPWNIRIPEAELPRLLNGFAPEDMDEKWFVCADGPDAAGDARLHLYRSWSGYKLAEVKIKVSLSVDDDGNIVPGDARMIGLIWEGNKKRFREQSEQAAKTMVLEVCRFILGVRLPGGDD